MRQIAGKIDGKFKSFRKKNTFSKKDSVCPLANAGNRYLILMLCVLCNYYACVAINAYVNVCPCDVADPYLLPYPMLYQVKTLESVF